MEKLVKGDIIGVWNKPFTQEQFEGKATLVKFLGKVPGRDKTEDWKVRFEGDSQDDLHRRTITF